MKTKPHYSLLRGHVVKRSSVTQKGQRSQSSRFRLKTGKDRLDGTVAPLSFYYGTECDANLCTYTKVAEVVAKNPNTEYSLWMPDFDWSKVRFSLFQCVLF